MAVPVEPPVTKPVVTPTDAMVGVLLLHMPPVVGSVNVVELPAQARNVPAIGAGAGFTVTWLVVKQPPPNE